MAKKSKPQPANPKQEQQVEALLREVDDALHYENLMTLWHKWKAPLMAALATLFVVVAATEGYDIYTHNKVQGYAKTYWQADGNTQALEALGEEGNLGFKLLAKLQQASAHATGGDVAAAQNIYETIATGNFPSEFKQLAMFYHAQLLLQEGQLEAAEQKLNSLNSTGNVYKGTVLEALAQTAELKGNNETALSFYEKVLETPNTPMPVQRRAQARIQALKI